MPRKNLPPFVQVLYSDKERTRIRGYRGWWRVGDKRAFGKTRQDPLQAHKDAMDSRGNIDAPMGGTVEQRANEWLEAIAARVASDTIDFYRGKLATVHVTVPKELPIERLTPAVLRTFVREAQDAGQSARTIQHCRRALNAMFGWLQRRGIVTNNPCTQVDWPKPVDKPVDYFTEAELADVLRRVTDPWASDLAIAMAYTCLRRAEFARLKPGAIDLERRVLWIHGKTRNVSQPIDPAAVPAFRRLVEAAAGREFLIPGPTDKRRRQTISETFRTWQRTLGDKRWHPHALRHSLGTIMLRQGANPAVVQRFLRHSSYATTQRYVHMIADDVQRSTAKLRLLGDDEAKAHG